MSAESRLTGGVLLILLPTVELGGVSLLTLLINQPAYSQNQRGQA